MCAVASGLPAGSEGPMAHIGAMSALVIVDYLVKPLFRGYAEWIDDEQTDTDERDYAAIGAGCGVAAAFKAPISATVLIIEELSSFFVKQHATHVLVSCVFAYHMVTILNSALGESSRPVFELQSPFEHCSHFVIWELLAFVFIGVTCGLLGALWNEISVRLNRIRFLYINAKPWRRAAELLLLVLVHSTLTIFLPNPMPESFKCQPSSAQIILRRSNMCVSSSTFHQAYESSQVYLPEERFWRAGLPLASSEAAAQAASQSGSSDSSGSSGRRLSAGGASNLPEVGWIPKAAMYGVVYDRIKCPEVHARCSNISRPASIATYLPRDATAALYTEYQPDYYCLAELDDSSCTFIQPNATSPLYVDLGANFIAGWACATSSADSSGSSGSSSGSSGRRLESSGDEQMSPMASLVTLPSISALRNVLLRGAPHLFPWQVLMIFVVVLFTISVLTSGTAIPSGIVVPLLLCGACVGRIIGLLVLAISEVVCEEKHPTWLAPHFLPLLSWLEEEAGVEGLRECSWTVDPANYALVGAGAMLAGTVRLRLFVIVLMVELTSDPIYILPCAIGVMVAVWCGDKCNHGIYHRLIDLASFPLLTDDPTLEQMHTSVGQLLQHLQQRVVRLHRFCSANEANLALELAHNAWPVVDERECFVGLITRRALIQAMAAQKAVRHFTSVQADLQKRKLARQAVSATSAADFADKILDVATRFTKHLRNEPIHDPLSSGLIDLGAFMDSSAYLTRPDTPVFRVHKIFTLLGTRHIPVVDHAQRAVGIITRKDLLPWVLHGVHVSSSTHADTETGENATVAHEKSLEVRIAQLRQTVLAKDAEISRLGGAEQSAARGKAPGPAAPAPAELTV